MPAPVPPKRRHKCPRTRKRPVSTKPEPVTPEPSPEPSPEPNFYLDLFKKTVLYDIENRVAAYLAVVFMLSLLADLITIPKIPYFSEKTNVMNQYFVKMAWGWNVLVLAPFVWLTAYVYCCGEKRRVIRHHLVRLAVATFFWKVWTTIFFVTTVVVSFFMQSSFDISGHCFILIYGSLVVIEEARVLEHWEYIKEYPRVVKCLPKQQAVELERNYRMYTPIIQGLFVCLVGLQLLWDVLLVITLLYYHTMSEKFIGATVGVGNWYFTYRCWYTEPCLLPRLPGDDLIQYKEVKKNLDDMKSDNASRSVRLSLSDHESDDSRSESSSET